jgi:hypothetical protein
MNGPRKAGAMAGRQQPCRGSIAIEFALGLLILALATWLAIEVLVRVRQHRDAAQFTSDLQRIAEIFERHPPIVIDPQRGAGRSHALPPGLVHALRETLWHKGPPFGGNYEWVPPATGRASRRGAIAVTAFSPAFPLKLSRADLLRIDRELDDGRLETGRFRTGFNGWPVYDLN